MRDLDRLRAGGMCGLVAHSSSKEAMNEQRRVVQDEVDLANEELRKSGITTGKVEVQFIENPEAK
jgi:hypothetical protein